MGNGKRAGNGLGAGKRCELNHNTPVFVGGQNFEFSGSLSMADIPIQFHSEKAECP